MGKVNNRLYQSSQEIDLTAFFGAANDAVMAEILFTAVNNAMQQVQSGMVAAGANPDPDNPPQMFIRFEALGHPSHPKPTP